MPRATKVETQSDLIYAAEALLAASIALEDDPETEQMALFEDQEAYDADLLADNTSDLLDITVLNWMEIAQQMTGDGSRGPYDKIPKSVDFFLDERDMFDWVVVLLCENPIFKSMGRRPQCHIKYQLGCFLICYGTYGSDTLGTAQKLSIGLGTVILYCGRVHSKQKLAIKTRIEDMSGFSKCLGAGDGSLINFDEIPMVDYMSQKKRFRTNIQATCDHKKHFTSFELSWPGSVPDVKIFKSSDLWMRHHLYFENGRFPSLRRMGPHQKIEDIYRTTETIMVLHNMAIDCNDHPNNMWQIDENFDDQDNNGIGDEELIVHDVMGEAQVPAYETDNYLKE
ncbi:hypothetical protein DFH08DRAFT_821639 [Mycena albidolilacea]|uniref:DDE Tnp4 domain-containing protein n=1 Tax=Mycena albidolilacea TaxID=1033008 RepID=A0AAD7EDG0_9AGAR|nr:hypothetical protein DFH08DRAFT_821639 [Mycena albidolilacea]